MRLSPAVQLLLGAGSAAAFVSFGVRKPHIPVAAPSSKNFRFNSALFQDLMDSKTKSDDVEQSPFFQPKAPQPNIKAVEKKKKESPPTEKMKDSVPIKQVDPPSTPAVAADSLMNPMSRTARSSRWSTTISVSKHVGEGPSMFEQMNQVRRRPLSARPPIVQEESKPKGETEAVVNGKSKSKSTEAAGASQSGKAFVNTAATSTAARKGTSDTAPLSPKVSVSKAGKTESKAEIDSGTINGAQKSNLTTKDEPKGNSSTLATAAGKVNGPSSTSTPPKRNAPVASTAESNKRMTSTDPVKSSVSDVNTPLPGSGAAAKSVVGGAGTAESSDTKKSTAPKKASASADDKAEAKATASATKQQSIKAAKPSVTVDQRVPPTYFKQTTKPQRTSFGATSMFEQMNQGGRRRVSSTPPDSAPAKAVKPKPATDSKDIVSAKSTAIEAAQATNASSKNQSVDTIDSKAESEAKTTTGLGSMDRPTKPNAGHVAGTPAVSGRDQKVESKPDVNAVAVNGDSTRTKVPNESQEKGESQPPVASRSDSKMDSKNSVDSESANVAKPAVGGKKSSKAGTAAVMNTPDESTKSKPSSSLPDDKPKSKPIVASESKIDVSPMKKESEPVAGKASNTPQATTGPPNQDVGTQYPRRTLTPLERKYASQSGQNRVGSKVSVPSQPKSTSSAEKLETSESPSEKEIVKSVSNRTLTSLEKNIESEEKVAQSVKKESTSLDNDRTTKVKTREAPIAKKKVRSTQPTITSSTSVETAKDDVLFFATPLGEPETEAKTSKSKHQESLDAEKRVKELEMTILEAQNELEMKLEELKFAQSIWDDEKKAYLELIGEQVDRVSGVEENAETNEKAMTAEAKETQRRLEQEIKSIQDSLNQAQEDLKEEREAAVEITSLRSAFEEQLELELASFEEEKKKLQAQICAHKDRLDKIEDQFHDEREYFQSDYSALQQEIDSETIKLEAIVGELDRQLARFDEERNELKQMLKDQSEKLAEATRKMTKGQSEFQSEKELLKKEFRREKEKLEHIVSFRETEQARFEEAKSELEMAIVYGKIKVKTLSSQLESEDLSFRLEIEELKRVVAIEKANVAKAEAQLEQEQTRMGNHINYLKDELREQSKLRRSERKSMLQQHSETRKRLTSRWRAVQKKAKEERVSLPAKFENQLAAANNTVAQLEIKIEGAKKSSNEMQAKLDELTREKDMIIGEREEAEERYKRTLDHRDGVIAERRKELEALYDEIYVRDEIIAKYEESFDELFGLAQQLTRRKLDRFFGVSYGDSE